MKIIKKIIKKLNDSLTVIIVLGIIIMINVLSAQFSFRFDLTDNGDYSVSNATKKTVAALDDVLIIKTYFSRNLPPKYLNLQQEVFDILEGYANYSGGRVRIEKNNPDKLVSAEEELGKKGIPALQFNVLKNDSFQVVKGFLGLSVEYGGKVEAIPVIDSIKTLEYDLTLAIKKISAEKMPVLGVVSSHGAVDPEQMKYSYGRLSQIYDIKAVDLKGQNIDLADLSALLLIGLSEKIEEPELKKIDAFVMSGKPVVFLVDGVNVNQQTGALKNQISLEKILNAYGVGINYDLLADVSSGRASLSSPGGSYYLTYQINYPLWPKVLPENLDQDNVISTGLSSIILPWASSVEILPGEGREAVVLAKTTDKAISQLDTYNLEPDGAFPGGLESKQYNLAVLVKGKMESPFGQGQTDQGRVAVVGDSNFVQDAFSGPVSDNLLFFQNLVDGLALDSDLINIRSKGAVERPIKPLSTAAKESLRYFNIFGISVLVLILGFVRYFLRRRGKKVPAASLPVVENFSSSPEKSSKAVALFFSAVYAKLRALIKKDKTVLAKPEAAENQETHKDIKN
jgi:gliding-associated putative ABC transporter substrate-binding component GldG